MTDTDLTRRIGESPVAGAMLAVALTTYGVVARQQERATGSAGSRNVSDFRGRSAARPSDVPKRGWWDVLMRVKDAISEKNLSLIAAGAAFYALLAIPAAITALVSLYGLVFDPDGIQRQVQGMTGILPDEAIKLMSDQLNTLASHSSSTLGVGLLVSVLLALWSARSGTSSLIAALNVAYEEPEKRGFIWFQVVALGLTAGIVLFMLFALGLIAVLPAVIGFLPLGELGKTVASIAPWPILLVLVMLGLAALYRYAPSREEPKWRWVSWGAALATAVWLIGSALFSLYVAKFAGYDKSYGSLGGVVVLLMWLYLSAFIVILGATLNAEIEHQTARDSTTGQSKPLGARGAKMADTVGRRR
ncbi:MAG: Ribonuclease [Rhodospirillales bacterium]|jgi:membrane protein|nr:Ribonuclease [Rhodospirillales bacterium]